MDRRPRRPLRILATGKALPAQRVTSAELDERLGHRSGFSEERSGVHARYLATPEEDQADLAAAALHDALARSGVPLSSIDLLIFASAIPVQALPCSAVQVLKAAGFPPGVPGFDVNLTCVSFVAALDVAAGLLAAGVYRRIAIVSADLASRGVDWRDPGASLIFGDGGAAAIVERGEGETGILASRLETYTEGATLCEIRGVGTRRSPRTGMSDDDFLFRMEGRALFRLTSEVVEGFLARLLQESELALDDIALCVPHQASHLAMMHIQKRLGIPNDRLVDIYREHGNQVAASLPTALHEARMGGRIRAGEPVLLLGTAAGLTLAGMVYLP